VYLSVMKPSEEVAMRGGALRAVLVLAAVGVAVMVPWAGPAAAGGGCHRGMTQGTGDRVEMVDACFTPSILQIAPGTEVTFANEDPTVHNVSAWDWGQPDDMMKGDSFTALFTEEGIYPFACSYHPGMTGAVVVGDGTGPGSGTPLTVGSSSDRPGGDIAPASSEGPNTATGWVGGAVLGLVMGAVAATVLRRRPDA
jgi:plastocyanin